MEKANTENMIRTTVDIFPLAIGIRVVSVGAVAQDLSTYKFNWIECGLWVFC